MPDKHKVTLAELRELAREALGGDYISVGEEREGEWFCTAMAGRSRVQGVSSSRMAARRQLRDLLERIIAGSSSDDYDRGYRDGKDGRHG